MVTKWVEIFGVTGRWLGAKSRSWFKFEEFGKGTLRQSTQSAIMYRSEIWLSNTQKLFITSRRRALSRGCERGKPVDCAWKLCLPGENFTILPEKSESCETARYRLCQPEHKQHSAMEQRPPERGWIKRLELTTEDRAMLWAWEMHSANVFGGREHAARQVMAELPSAWALLSGSIHWVGMA